LTPIDAARAANAISVLDVLLSSSVPKNASVLSVVSLHSEDQPQVFSVLRDLLATPMLSWDLSHIKLTLKVFALRVT
jgi:hypothetical protein